MAKLLILCGVIIAKTLLCQIIAVVIFLLEVYLKGRKFDFQEDKWDAYFAKMSFHDVTVLIAQLYLVGAILASAFSYSVLNYCHFEYALVITLLLFVGGILVTGVRWHYQGRAVVLSKFKKLTAVMIEKSS